MTIKEWLKPGLWGAAFGAVALLIVGFSTGWVVSSGSAKTMADSRAEKAVLAALTPICVAQFRIATKTSTLKPTGEDAAKNSQGPMLAALKKEDSWKRGDFVKKQGWATMPGSAEPNGEVASTCATELMKISAKITSK